MLYWKNVFKKIINTTVSWRQKEVWNKIIIELDIYYAIRAIRGVQQAKPTRQKVVTYLKNK